MNEPAARSRSSFWRSFGPGLIWAATSIGVSHLVQSTRAGAEAGFAFVGVIVFALVLKYPFFEYGARYAAATRRSLVEGYRDIGRWALWLFLAITLVTAIISLAALAMFMAFLTRYAFGAEWPLAATGAVLMGACVGVLAVGRFRGLDITIKILLAMLVVSTVATALVAAPRADLSTLALWPGDVVGTVVPFAFLLALIGWMPSPVDVAVWSSLWTLAKDKTTGARTSVADAKRDFLVGFVGTGILALIFVSVGATVLFQADVTLSAAGAVFSTQLVDMYSTTLGSWSRPIVLVAAMATIFSSLLAVTDGFPRAIERTLANLRGHVAADTVTRVGRVYWWSMIALPVVAFFILLGFSGSLTAMVDFATTVAFLTAPILGYFNLRAVTSEAVPPEHRPGRGMVTLSWVGLVLLGGTGLAYLVSLVR
ncbi:MAG: divalent metal cation transporter [Gemmatimonadales bacterium]|uniref:NRAMP family divalent metal transporter n=1 Tax=Candidatus Palauibacter irciniicola TaxID=3056733 RepID=UPI001380BC3F|nr:divalent metal cation transporter [Candidatus Palauibacter irciniicola]MYC18329.1 divalent metal cation transporter [Gemmatimonadales bacterium]